MAQHDYVIDNQSFPATRTDINNALLAISSTNSGATAPSTTYANQLWYDTSENKLYIRNEDNDAWIPLFLLDQSNDVAGTLATQIDVEDASGTNTAGTALTIKAGASTGSATGGSIIFQTADGGSSGSSVNAHATRVTIADDGKVGIGVTSSLGSLLTIARNNSVGFMNAAGTAADQIIYGDSSSNLRFFTSASERMRILAGGGLTFNGDTAAANALDDYEEGTWTPSNPEVTLTVTHSRYTKIGRFLYISFDITFPSNSNTGLARIEGLPYSVAEYSGGFTHWTQYGSQLHYHCTGTTMYTQNPTNPDNTLQNQNVSGIRMIGNAVLQV